MVYIYHCTKNQTDTTPSAWETSSYLCPPRWRILYSNYCYSGGSEPCDSLENQQAQRQQPWLQGSTTSWPSSPFYRACRTKNCPIDDIRQVQHSSWSSSTPSIQGESACFCQHNTLHPPMKRPVSKSEEKEASSYKTAPSKLSCICQEIQGLNGGRLEGCSLVR